MTIVMMSYVFLKNRLSVREYIDYPTVVGHVERAFVQNAPSVRNGNRYKVIVHYWYMVDGVKYESERFDDMDELYVLRSDAEKRIEDFPKEKNIRVHFNPKDPGQAMAIKQEDAQ